MSERLAEAIQRILDMRVAPDAAVALFQLRRGPGPGQTPVHVDDPSYDSWEVVRDFAEIESASFWYDSPEIETGQLRTEDIATEVFFLPAAAHTEKDGSFTNTQRLLQWHHTAVEPPADVRSDLWFVFHLGRIIREKLAASTDPKDRPLLELTWDYPTHGAIAEAEDGGAAVIRDAIRGADQRGTGHATLIKGSPELRRSVPVFQPQPSALEALTGRIKESFDPRGILNPGRMVDGC